MNIAQKAQDLERDGRAYEDSGMIIPSLAEYQHRFVQNVRSVIGSNWLRRTPCIRMLDMGCDTSGNQLRSLAGLTRGEVVGINIPQNFPTDDARRVAGERVKLLRMDGTRLEFEDECFDLVISANVMEHVSDPELYVRECARVLKPDGLAYIETAPVWSSARGHHVMTSMIHENCPTEASFRDDGSILPEWGHLSMTQSELEAHLQGKVAPATVQYILWYLFQSGDLNRATWSSIHRILSGAFPVLSVNTWPLPDVSHERMPDNRNEDYLVYGFSAVGRKKPLSGLARRLYWRLRQLGL